MGTTLHEIVFEIGGGPAGGKQLKAVQTGGPAGGCIPAKMIDLRIDFDTLAKTGSIMGSGGMIILDEDDCMVDIAKFFMTFSQDESCGKCTPCREGTMRMLEILDRITGGKGDREDLEKLERLATAGEEVVALRAGPRGRPIPCSARWSTSATSTWPTSARSVARPTSAWRLSTTRSTRTKCVGCTACARNCPVECISRRAQGAARDRPDALHQVRPLLPSLPLRGRLDGYRNASVRKGKGKEGKRGKKKESEHGRAELERY